MENRGNKDLKELYEEWIKNDIEKMKFIGEENKVFARIRENKQDDWEAVEICRELMWSNVKQLDFLKERIDYVTSKLKKLG